LKRRKRALCWGFLKRFWGAHALAFRGGSIALLILCYRRLEHWVDWQCQKNGVPLIVVNPRGTSTTCPRCNTKLIESGYRRMRCSRYGFGADRDTVAVLNVERKALSEMWGALTP
jgi:hypothetical protein